MTAPGGRNVRIVISADVAQALRAFQQTEQGLGSITQSADSATKKTSTMGDVFKGTLAASGVQAGLSGIVDGFKSVVSGGLDYESSINTFRAVTQANDEQMKQMADTAKQLGNDITIPGASAQTAAAAMTELAKGGLTAAQAMEASRGTMILAAAAQIDGAQAAEIQSNALNTFGLKADEAGRVANVLANVANQSSGEITDFSQGLQQAGTIASAFGWSIEETTSVLGLMANAGIKGSDAGTSLKTAMTALLNPTKAQAAALDELGIVTQDANGNMISASQLTASLAAAKGRMSDAEFSAAAATAFGTDAVRTALVVAAAGTEGYDKMSAALGNVTGAQDVAAANSKGLTGIIDALKNTIDTASLSLYEALAPALGDVTTAVTGVVGPMAEGLAPVLSSVAGLLTGALAPALEGVSGFLGAVAGPISSFVDFFNGLPGPVGTAVLALGGVIALRGPLIGTFTSASATLTTLLATMRGTAGAAAAGSAGFTGFIASLRAASGAAATFGVVARGALSVLGGPIGLALVGVVTALSLFSSSTDDAAGSTTDFTGAIDENTGALKDNAPAVTAKALADSGSLDLAEKVGVATSDYTRAVLEQGDALNSVRAQIEATALQQVQASDKWEDFTLTANAQGLTVEQLTQKLLAAGSGATVSLYGFGDLAKAYNNVTGEAENFGTTQRRVNQANETAAEVAGGAAKGVTDIGDAAATAEQKATPFADAMKDLRSATAEADANLQFLSITLLEMAGNQVPADQRARALAASYRGVGQAARDLADAHDSEAEKQAKLAELTAHLGTTLDGQAVSATNLAVTQADVDRAARDLADAQNATAAATDRMKDAQDKAAQSARDATAEAYNNAVSQGNLRGAVDAATQTMAAQREQFIKTQVEAGLTQEAAEALANAQGLIPENVRTTYETKGADEAKKHAKELNDALDKINDRTVHYSVVGGEVTTVGTMRGTSSGMAVYASGGFVSGPGSATSDSIPARLSNGEFVVRASQTARHRQTLEMINTPGFADGGLVGAQILGDYKSKDFTDTLGKTISSLNEAIKASLYSFSGGLNPSQNPASFGWQRAAGIVPFSWNGYPFLGGVAGGTQGLWTGLMNALVPQIPGGLMAPIYAYENRNNVNSPGVASFHAYGLAADINAPQNPNGAPGDGRSGPGVIPAGVARSLAARFGMEWGGDFRGTPDPMHFEIHVSPNQIGAGGTINLGVGAGGGSSAAGVQQWMGTILQALSITGQPASYSSYVARQMMTESSGNPRAINNYDINAQRGTPSKGLMQVIDPTFRAYALPGYNTDIYDPLSNIIASIRYVLDRYGSIPAGMPGVAYDNGGILPPGFTMAYNGTGQNEAIFTGQQFNAMAAQAVPQQSMSPRIEITNYVDIHGMLTRTEAMVDGKLVEVARTVTTAGAQTR